MLQLQQQHLLLVQLQVTFCLWSWCDFIVDLSVSIAFACQVALVPAAAQVLLVPTLAATCLVQAALEAACLAHQALLLLDPARQPLDQVQQALGGEHLQCMLSKCFTSSSALLHSCFTEQLCCLSAHSFDVTHSALSHFTIRATSHRLCRAAGLDSSRASQASSVHHNSHSNRTSSSSVYLVHHSSRSNKTSISLVSLVLCSRNSSNLSTPHSLQRELRQLLRRSQLLAVLLTKTAMTFALGICS